MTLLYIFKLVLVQMWGLSDHFKHKDSISKSPMPKVFDKYIMLNWGYNEVHAHLKHTWSGVLLYSCISNPVLISSHSSNSKPIPGNVISGQSSSTEIYSHQTSSGCLWPNSLSCADYYVCPLLSLYFQFTFLLCSRRKGCATFCWDFK